MPKNKMKPQELTAIEKLKARNKDDNAWVDALPDLPEKPSGEKKTAVVIKKRKKRG